jgi:hypothetical protein
MRGQVEAALGPLLDLGRLVQTLGQGSKLGWAEPNSPKISSRRVSIP